MVGFGKNLAKKRKELHFSQNKLSEKLELCEETIKNYERGEGILLHRAYKIADFLDRYNIINEKTDLNNGEIMIR